MALWAESVDALGDGTCRRGDDSAVLLFAPGRLTAEDERL